MKKKMLNCIVVLSCVIMLACWAVSCGMYYKESPHVNYDWLSSHPYQSVALLPFDSRQPDTNQLAESLRREFYLSLVSKNIPTVPLYDVDKKLVSVSLRKGIKPENLSRKELIDIMGTRLIGQGELTSVSRLFLLFYSHIQAKGKFWLRDYETGEQIFYNDVRATNRLISLPASLIGIATEGLNSLAHLRKKQIQSTVIALGERAGKPLPQMKQLQEPSPRIHKINVNVKSRELRIGDVIEVEAWGPAGLTAWFDIGPEAKRIPMEEKSAGYYVGRYVISPGDNVEYGLVRVAMQGRDENDVMGAVNFDTPLTIDAQPPPPPFVAEFHTTSKAVVLNFSLSPKPPDLKDVFIYRAYDINGKPGEFSFIGLPDTNLVFVDKEIEPRTTYYYTAMAVDEFGNSSGTGKQFKINLPDKGPTLLRGKFQGTLVLMRYASPFFIDSVIEVDSRSSLVIEPGVNVYFYKGGGIRVNGGTLKIKGSPEEPVYLGAYEDQWVGIACGNYATNNVSFENVELHDARIGLKLDAGNASLSRVVFKKCVRGLDLNQSVNGWLYYCRFEKNGAALVTSAGKLSLNHCDFVKNDANIASKTKGIDLLPMHKVYDVSAYISGDRLVPSRATQDSTATK